MRKGIKRFTSMVMGLVMILSLLPVSAMAAPTTSTKLQAVSPVAADPVERKVIGYFPEWAFKNDSHMNYTADKMPWDKITHINYAFAIVNPVTNKIDFGDKNAAIERDFPGQTNEFPYKGHFNVLNSYKKKYPNVKTLISVGGWAGTSGFYTMTDTAAGRETFATSVVEFLKTYGFNGVDIDFEYPTATTGAGNPDDLSLADSRRKTVYANYVELMKTLREKLDAAGTKDNQKYLLTAALPASSWILGGMGLGEYAKYLDYANLMTYDFHGAWNGYVGHNAALYPDERDPETQGFAMPVLNIDWAYRYFRGALPAEKINIGIPYYTRGWKDVTPGTLPGGLYGKAATTGGGAVGVDNIWFDVDKNGKEIPGGTNPLWHALNLMKTGDYVRYFDDKGKVPYLWNEKKKVFLSYEDEQSMEEKLKYVLNKNLGGIMIWELDGDFGKAADGSYTVGDTLTALAKTTFDKAGLLKPTTVSNTLPTSKFKVDFTGSYDHPNYTYTMNVVNNTGKEIPAGWKLEFDMPKSAFFTSAWGVTIDQGVDKGDFTHHTITGPGWKALAPGESYPIQGIIKLSFTGGPQNFVLNGYASEYEVGGVVTPPTQVNTLQAATLSAGTVTNGAYTLTASVPAKNTATSYKFLEGTTVVGSGTLTAGQTTVTALTQALSNKAPGTYSYTVQVSDATGTLTSNQVSVTVPTPPSPNTLQAATLSASAVTNGSYTLTASVPAKNTATSYKFLEGTTVVGSGTLTAGQTTATVLTQALSNKPAGTYSYTVQVSDGTGTLTSTPVSVTVSATPQSNTLQAAILSASAVSNGGYTLTASVPAKNTATSYKFLEGTTVIGSGTLTAGQTTAATLTQILSNKPAGTYTYTVQVSDATGMLSSNTVSVTVPTPPVGGTSSLNVDFKVTSDWGTGANYAFNVTNKSTKNIVSWKVKFNSPINITAAWGGTLASLGNKQYTISNDQWASAVKPGAVVAITGACDGNSTTAKITSITTTVTFDDGTVETGTISN